MFHLELSVLDKKNIMKKTFYFFLVFVSLLFASFSLSSQVLIHGTVNDALEGRALGGVEIKVIGTEISVISDPSGSFSINLDQAMIYNLSFSLSGYESYFGSANAKLSTDVNLGSVKLIPAVKSSGENITESDNSYETDNEGQRVSSMLSASSNLFDRTAQFNFRVAGFDIRGLNSEYSTMLLNGVPFEDLEDGYISWNDWGGLNDVTKAGASNITLEPSFFDFGSLGGSTNLDLSASAQWKQTRISYAETNRNYRHRIMLTHSSGMKKNGWAYSFSASRRWAEEGYVPGTFYDGYSAFASIDKKLNNKNLINLVALVSPVKRGVGAAATKEMYELADDHYYNSNWGYQNGEKRNARVNSSFLPIVILKHVWKFKRNSDLTSSLGFQTGTFGKTRLDWYYASDPRPDYYQYLPSYQSDPDMNSKLKDLYANNKDLLQINWDDLYKFNHNATGDFLEQMNYTGDISKEKFSHYVIQEQREDPTRFAFNTILQSILSNKLSLNGGLSYVNQKTHYHQVLNDLLGGTFFVNFDKYAERDFPDDLNKAQYDLINPNKVIRQGDDYGYNYEINTGEAQGWAKLGYSANRIDGYIAGQLTNTSFFRNGIYKNGKFPENSYGKSTVSNFQDFGAKAGITFKLNGRNYLYANIATLSKAPFARNAFISPRTRNDLVPDLKSEKLKSGEVGYMFRSPTLMVQLTGYYIGISDKLKVTSFFLDEQQTFVNYIMNGIAQTHTGIEFSTEYKFTPAFSANAIASYGQYLYSERPTATISQDNNSTVLTNQTIYIKNYRVPGTPQQAYSLGLRYSSPKYWFATISFNYFDDMYLDFNPDRRTSYAVDGIDPVAQKDQWNSIINQEKLPSGFTADLFGGKSWRLKNKNYIYLNVGINNILNNTNFLSGGFEQFRFDYISRDVAKFPSKYYYAYGLNYYISVSYKM